jgi:TM2 domain-containing membrane protein YozV
MIIIPIVLVGIVVFGIGWLIYKFPLEGIMAICIMAIIIIGWILLSEENKSEW